MGLLKRLFGGNDTPVQPIASQSRQSSTKTSTQQLHDAELLYRQALQLWTCSDGESRRKGLLMLVDVTERNPNHFGAHLKLAQLSFQLPSMPADSCVSFASTACRIDPSSVEAKRALSCAHFKKGQECNEAEDWNGAFDAYKHSLAAGASSENASVLFMLLSTTAEPERANRQQEFVEICRALMKDDPEDDNTRFTLGMTLLSLEQYDEAIQHLKEYARRKPGTADGHYALARIYSAIGNQDEAKLQRDALAKLDARRAAELDQLISGAS